MNDKKRKMILLVPMTLVLCLIWGNSMLPGEVSASISGGSLGWLVETFPFLEWLPEWLLRKLGHFSEFGLFGFLSAWFFLEQKGIHRFSMPLLLSLLAGNIDETIQTITPDRGPSVIDVWIDTCGACAGILGFSICCAVYYHFHNQKGVKI